ncbi:MAG: SDR family oxidoreductase [Candidatus Magasanikbacteria bacterium]
MPQTALITGASSGIGLELAKLFAQDKYDLVLVARNENKLNELAKNLESEYQIKTKVLVFDLIKDDSPQLIFAELQKENISIDVLVNNAGFGTYGDFKNTNLTTELEMIKLNISSLVEMTKLFLKPMLEKKSGKIIQVASTAAFQPGPHMAVYYATKAFVLNFSEAVAEEIKNTGVTITTLCPGPTTTNFQEVANIEFPKSLKIMSAEEVAKIGYNELNKNKSSVVIAGLRNKLFAFTVRLLPRKVVTRIVASL